MAKSFFCIDCSKYRLITNLGILCLWSLTRCIDAGQRDGVEMERNWSGRLRRRSSEATYCQPEVSTCFFIDFLYTGTAVVEFCLTKPSNLTAVTACYAGSRSGRRWSLVMALDSLISGCGFEFTVTWPVRVCGVFTNDIRLKMFQHSRKIISYPTGGV